MKTQNCNKCGMPNKPLKDITINTDKGMRFIVPDLCNNCYKLIELHRQKMEKAAVDDFIKKVFDSPQTD